MSFIRISLSSRLHLQRDGAWTLANYREVLSQSVVLEAILNSIGLSVFTVLLCAIVGVPLAFLFERFDFPGRRVFAALAALPLVLPPLVGTVAFIFLYGESGILAHSIQNLFALETPPWSTARLARVAVLSHVHDVSVFLRAYRRGIATDRCESRRGSAEFGCFANFRFYAACCSRN